MNTTNKILGVVLLTIIFFAAGFGLGHYIPSTVKFGTESTSLPDGLIVGGGTYVDKMPFAVVGTTTQLEFGQSINGPGLSGIVNPGPQLSAARFAMATGTTTPCSIQAPAATSTLIYGFANISTTTGYALSTTVTIAQAATQFATTTVLATSTMAANAQDTMTAATTTPVADSTNGRATLTNLVFGPNTWMVVSLTGSSTYNPVGSCGALWGSVN